MATITSPQSFAVLSTAINQEAPGRIQLFPAGEFRSSDIRPVDAPAWKIDAVVAAVLCTQLAALKNPLVIDYEHQTLKAETNGLPAPAAGWMHSFEWVDGEGLFADVTWTATAAAYIAKGEYKFISPVFAYLPGTGQITTLLHAALVNSPAIDGMEAVMAALSSTFLTTTTALKKEISMDMEEALKTVRWMLNLPETVTAEEAKLHLMRLVEAIGGVESTTAASIDLFALLEAKETKIAALSANQVDPAKHAPVDGMRELKQQVAALSQQLLAKEQAEQDKAANDLVTVALSDGRLTPAMKDWALDLAKKDVASLNQFLSTAQPIAALSQQQTGGKQPTGDKPKLTENQLAICSATGVSQEDFLKTLNGENQ